jgi:DNA transposition AAA+ family ATPase
VRETPFTPEQESIITRVDAMITEGVPVARIISRTGVQEEHLLKLRRRQRWGLGLKSAWQDDEAISALGEFLDLHESKQEPHDDAKTPTFLTINSLVDTADYRTDFIAITGGFGVGKSKALIHAVQKNPRGYGKPGRVRVEFSKTDNNPSAALYSILKALAGETGSSRVAYRTGNLLDAVCKELGLGDCLIADECNYLGEAADILRNIHYRSGASVVMSGNPDFQESVWGEKSQSFGALASRAMLFKFPSTTLDDACCWLDWKGVTGVKLRDALARIAIRPGQNGGLRTLARIFDCWDGYLSHLSRTEENLKQVITVMGRAPAQAQKGKQ